MLSPIAEELNQVIQRGNADLFETLSDLGKALYFPKGILTQTAEAKEKAHRYNATIGIAKSQDMPLYLESVYSSFQGLSPGQVFPYAPAFGVPELRETWKRKIEEDNPSLGGKAISLPVVTSGITHGLSLAGDLFVNEGDTVLAPDKVWGNYLLLYGVRYGAEISRYPLLGSHGGLDTEGFKETLDNRAAKGKLFLLLNFPNNPTGYAPTRKEAESLVEAILDVAEQGCSVVAVSDDSYFGLFYEDGVYRESLFGLLAGLHPRIAAVKLDGATKEDFVWGFRTGFISYGVAAEGNIDPVYESLEKKTGGAIRGGISNCSMPAQSILLKAMERPEFQDERKKTIGILKERALRVRDVLSRSKYQEVWEPYPFNSGYFMCIRLKGLNAEAYRKKLLEDHGVGVISASDTDIRIAFSCVEASDIPELFDIMYDCAKGMRKDSQR